MRTMLTVTALVVFVVSTSLLEMTSPNSRPVTALPPAMGTFQPAKVDATATSSTTRPDKRGGGCFETGTSLTQSTLRLRAGGVGHNEFAYRAASWQRRF